MWIQDPDQSAAWIPGSRFVWIQDPDQSTAWIPGSRGRYLSFY